MSRRMRVVGHHENDPLPKGKDKPKMKTNSNREHKEQAEPERLSVWRKILNLLLKYGGLISDVEKATGRKYDVREWIQ
jgi:hypothetical protein